MKEINYELAFKVLIAVMIVLVVALGYFYANLTEAYGVIKAQTIELEQALIELEDTHGELKSEYNTLLEEHDSLKKENEKLKNKAKNDVALSYDFTEEEIYMLAQCVEAEAGIGNTQSQKYVAQVILNRLHTKRGYPNTLEGVIYHKTAGNVPQFSVAYNGAMEGRVVKEETLNTVRDVLENGTDLPKYIFFFYSEEVTNNWVNTLNIYTKVEGTVFAYASKEY